MTYLPIGQWKLVVIVKIEGKATGILGRDSSHVGQDYANNESGVSPAVGTLFYKIHQLVILVIG